MNNSMIDRALLKLALDVSLQSNDPSTKVGAVLVGPDGHIKATGYNKFPDGIAETEVRLNDREVKLGLVVHAEIAAVARAARFKMGTDSATIFVAARSVTTGEVWGGPPCHRCLVELIEAGVVEFVSFPRKTAPSAWAASLEKSVALINEAGLRYREVPLHAGHSPLDGHPDATIKDPADSFHRFRTANSFTPRVIQGGASVTPVDPLGDGSLRGPDERPVSGPDANGVETRFAPWHPENTNNW